MTKLARLAGTLLLVTALPLMAQSLNTVPEPAAAPETPPAEEAAPVPEAAPPAAPAPAPAPVADPLSDYDPRNDPFIGSALYNKKASRPLPFGVYGQIGYTVYSGSLNMADADSNKLYPDMSNEYGRGGDPRMKDGKFYRRHENFEAPLEIEIWGYWDVIELGLHRNQVGNYITLNNRIYVTRDWTYGVQLEGGLSKNKGYLGGLGGVFEAVGIHWMGAGRMTFGFAGSSVYVLMDGGVGYRFRAPFRKTPLTVGAKIFCNIVENVLAFDEVDSTNTLTVIKADVDEPEFMDPERGFSKPGTSFAWGATLFVRYAFNLQIK